MNNRTVLIVLIVILLAAAIGVWGALTLFPAPGSNDNANTVTNQTTGQATSVVRFSSSKDFQDYLAAASALDSTSTYGGMVRQALPSANSEISGAVGLGSSDAKSTTPDRYSTTNVQVAGIDEPDIVKTDGTNIFLSTEAQRYYTMPMMEELRIEDVTGVGTSSDIMQAQATPKARVLKALPPESLSQIGSLEASGDLLLDGQQLVVFDAAGIKGFDVSTPSAPKATWTLTHETSQVVDARMRDHVLYVVSKTQVNRSRPCPIEPMALNNVKIAIPCAEIYHPASPTNIDVTYTVISLDPKTGEKKATTTFVGSDQSSVVYMSDAALYVTYPVYADPFTSMYRFVTEGAGGLFPASVLEKMKRLQGYDLSAQTKLTELTYLLDQYQQGLDADAQTKLQADLTNRMTAYQAKHQRELVKTGIIKVRVPELAVDSTGAVPGQPLNQFSLDEYQDTLRIATTTGGGWSFGFSSDQSVNDVYTLDAKLKQVGAVLDLGKGERIYGVRFINDRGYVVTFKQVDPFYVLDLADPSHPALAGELKIPGYSSYLEPISATMVLGVGEENQKVKVALFDVSKPDAPTELSKYELNEYWTAVQSSHHAFLRDPKHAVIFLPAGTTGYVLSYAGNTLSLKKAVTNTDAQRALYINDNLYVIGNQKIVVLDEATWSSVKELTLSETQ